VIELRALFSFVVQRLFILMGTEDWSM